MTLNASGPISVAGTTTGQSIQVELGGNGTTQMSLNDSSVRTLAGVPSGAITMPTNFWGKSNWNPPANAAYSFWGNSNSRIFDFSTGTVSNFTGITASMFGIAGTSSGSFVYMAGAFSSPTIFKYQISLNTVTSSAALAVSTYVLTGAGMSTAGMWAAGSTSGGKINTTRRVLYSNDSIVASVAIGVNRDGGAAFSNATTAIYANGNTTSAVNTANSYTWSNNTTAGVTARDARVDDIVPGFSNSTRGVIAGGSNQVGAILNTGQFWTYSNSTWTSTGNLTAPYFRGSGCSNSTTGMIPQGSTTGGSDYLINQTYNHSNNTFATSGTSTGTFLTRGASGASQPSF